MRETHSQDILFEFDLLCLRLCEEVLVEKNISESQVLK